jgi:hypothetical protein
LPSESSRSDSMSRRCRCDFDVIVQRETGGREAGVSDLGAQIYL